jgi:hypothetical protein
MVQIFYGPANSGRRIRVFQFRILAPGILGEVLRHNQAHSIDASPLFYSEVENMAELEKDVLRMREKKNEEKRGTAIKNAGVQGVEPLP